MPRAAVLTEVGRPLEIVDLDQAPPGPGEVRIRVAAAGVCHTDLSLREGTVLASLPVVLGHEGAGVVEEVGPGVEGLAPGDHVVVSWVPQCGGCYYCRRGQAHLCEVGTTAMGVGILLDGTTRLRRGDVAVRQMAAVGVFSETAVIPAISAVKVPGDIPLPVAALVGCAVLTGVGAALTTAPVRPGDTVAVVGCGGVGLNVVQGARLAGAARIIAVDVQPAKLDLARLMGATDVVDARTTPAVGAVMDLTAQRGADVAFEVIGLQATIDQVVAMTRRGGQAVLVGLPRIDALVTLPAMFGLVLADKTVRGCWYGSADVRRDVPRVLDLYRRGELRLDELVSRTATLDDVNDALDALSRGEVTRTVIVPAT